jgi:hypothetical protein
MKMPDELQRAFESIVNDAVERRLKRLTPQIIIGGEVVDHDRVEIVGDEIIIHVRDGQCGVFCIPPSGYNDRD